MSDELTSNQEAIEDGIASGRQRALDDMRQQHRTNCWHCFLLGFALGGAVATIVFGLRMLYR
jgi:hypothetical protein